ncbi:MAG: response regulator transcription factor [Chloroflexi bacterium]|nr:response regulator transcription factor [Chloroflexota bacterium]
MADDPLARAGLSALLSDQGGIQVSGRVSGHDDVSASLEVYRPDVILWDLGGNPTLVIDGLADLRDLNTPVVALIPDAEHAPEVLSAGARGVLFRDSDAQAILTALRAVFEGLMVLAPELLAAPVTHRKPAPLVEELTPREIEVLRLLAEGLSNKLISKRLGISEHTVKFHVNAIMGKLGAQSRTEAVVLATRWGLILL